MRGVPLVVLVTVLAGCISSPEETLAPAETPAPLPLAGDLAPGTDLRLVLPAGPSSAAFLLKVDPASWDSLSLLGLGPPARYWRLLMDIDFEGLDELNGENGTEAEGLPAVRAGAVLYRVEDKALTMTDSFKFLAPADSDDDEILPYDLQACAPPEPVQYLLVVALEEGTNVTARLSIPGPDEEEPVRVRPDLEGGAPLLAHYDHPFGQPSPEGRGWTVEDGRTRVPTPAYTPEAGPFSLLATSPPGNTGLFAFGSFHEALFAEAGHWSLEAGPAGGPATRAEFPIAGAYASQQYLLAAGDYADGLALRTTIDAARGSPVSDRFSLLAAPLDVAELGLGAPRMEDQTALLVDIATYFGKPAVECPEIA